MLSLKSNHYTFQNGKLKTKQSYCQTQFQKTIQYSHTVRQQPDQYHIQTIKQFKKQLDEMRKNYEELRRAYWYMLGYRIEGDQRIPKFSFIKQKNNYTVCVTQVSESHSRMSNLQISNLEIRQAISDIEENKRKIDKLDDKLTESIIEYRVDLLKPTDNRTNYNSNKDNDNYQLTHSSWDTKTKTQTDQPHQYQQFYCLKKQHQQLKQKYQQLIKNNQSQLKQYKLSYQQHIKKLQQILERQRKHTKMLNNVINRMRNQLNIKQNYIKMQMKVKNLDKAVMEGFMKELKNNL